MASSNIINMTEQDVDAVVLPQLLHGSEVGDIGLIADRLSRQRRDCDLVEAGHAVIPA